MGLGGSTARAPASEGRQFGEKPVQRHEVNSSPGKGRRISPLIFHRNAAYGDMSYLPGYPGQESTALQVQGKCFPTVEFQHRTKREDEKMQNLVAWAMLTVDSVLRVEDVICTSRLEPNKQVSVSNATFAC